MPDETEQIAVIKEIDRVRCLVHKAFGTESLAAIAGLALYRAAVLENQSAGKAEGKTANAQI